MAGRPGQQLRGTAQGTPLPLAPLDSAGARWVGGETRWGSDSQLAPPPLSGGSPAKTRA